MSVVPIGALVVLARLIILAVEQARSSNGDEPPPSRGASIGTFGLAFLTWVILGPTLLALLQAVLNGTWLAFPFLILVIAALAPWPFARRVLIPLGWVKPTWVLMRMPSISFAMDPRGGAALAAAHALLRRKHPDATLAAWVEEKIAALSPLRGAGITAQGLLLASRADHRSAEQMLASVEYLGAIVAPPPALRIAREWRAAYFATRGDWDRVGEIAGVTGTTSRLTDLLGTIAAHMTGAEEKSRALIWTQWLIAPRQWATYRFVKDALARPFGIAGHSDPKPVEVFTEEHTGHLDRALRLGAALMLRKPESIARSDLRELASCWDRALTDPAFSSGLEHRAAAIGSQRWSRIPAALESELEEELARMLRSSKAAASESGEAEPQGLFARALRRVRSDLLGDVENAAATLRKLEGSIEDRRSIDAWREFITLRAFAEDAFAFGGRELERLAFPALHGPVSGFAVGLFNEKRERAIGNAMFTWLLELALAVGDQRAADIQQRNVDCGCL